MSNVHGTAKQFIDYYYSVFDTDRAGLRRFYVRFPMISLAGSSVLMIFSGMALFLHGKASKPGVEIKSWRR